MADCLGWQVVLFIPGTCPLVQERDLAGLFLQRVREENLGEKVMIAVPLALVIEGNDEQVAPLQGFQYPSAILLPSDSISDRTA